MAGPGKTVVYGRMMINGDGYKSLEGRTLDNWGYAIWSGSNIGVGNGTVIINERDASFDVQNNGNMEKEYEGTPPRFDSWGTVRKVGGGTTSFGDEVGFNNYGGAVEVQVGTLRLGGGTSSGSFFVAAGANLSFGGGQHTLTGPSRVTGPGEVTFSDRATTTVEGRYDVGDTYVYQGSVLFNRDDSLYGSATTGTLTIDTGGFGGPRTVTVNGPLVWTGSGTMAGPGKTVVYGRMLIDGDGYKSLEGRTLENWGYGIWNGSNIGTGNGTVIINERDATFDVQNNGNLGKDYEGTPPRFDNWGTLRKVVGGTTNFGDEVGFNNYGAVEVDVGTLRLGGGTSSGSFLVAAGANLNFGGGQHTLTTPSRVTGPGGVTFNDRATSTVEGRYDVGETYVDHGSVLFNSNVITFTLTIDTGGLGALAR